MADEHRHRTPTAGAHPHLNSVESLTGENEIPKFKRERKKEKPRLAPIMGLTWAAGLFMAILRLVQGIKPIDQPDRWDAHYLVDSLVALVLVICISYLWSAWEREEQFPQLLPRKEFDRRYPPSSASPPLPQPEEREYHRRIRYDTDTTMTGGQKLDPHAEPMRVYDSPPPMPSSGQMLNRNGAAAIPKVTSSTPPPPPPMAQRLPYTMTRPVSSEAISDDEPLRRTEYPR